MGIGTKKNCAEYSGFVKHYLETGFFSILMGLVCVCVCGGGGGGGTFVLGVQKNLLKDFDEIFSIVWKWSKAQFFKRWVCWSPSVAKIFRFFIDLG